LRGRPAKSKGGKLPSPISPTIRRRGEREEGRRRSQRRSTRTSTRSSPLHPTGGRGRGRGEPARANRIWGGRGWIPGAAPFRLPISLPIRIPAAAAQSRARIRDDTPPAGGDRWRCSLPRLSPLRLLLPRHPLSGRFGADRFGDSSSFFVCGAIRDGGDVNAGGFCGGLLIRVGEFACF